MSEAITLLACIGWVAVVGGATWLAFSVHDWCRSVKFKLDRIIALLQEGLPSRRCLGRCGKSFRPPHKGRFMCDTCVRSASGAVYGW